MFVTEALNDVHNVRRTIFVEQQPLSPKLKPLTKMVIELYSDRNSIARSVCKCVSAVCRLRLAVNLHRLTVSLSILESIEFIEKLLSEITVVGSFFNGVLYSRTS